MRTKVDKLGKVSVTVEKDYHSLDKEYPKLTIVEEKNAFKTYVSRKPVPVGTQLTDREYWIPFSGVTESIVLDYNNFKTEFLQAEALRVVAENERVNAENERKTAERVRNSAEITRDHEEATRQENEDTRIAQENTRATKENERQDNEIIRNNYETIRKNNENSRTSNETTRQNKERERTSSESTRLNNETIRINNENVRISNENLRQKQEGSTTDTPSATGSRWARYKQAENDRNTQFNQAQVDRQNTYNQAEGTPEDEPDAGGSRWARYLKAESDRDAAIDEIKEDYTKKEDLEKGNVIPALAYNLEAWADQKAIATPDTYTDAVRTTGGDIPIETSAGSKLESIKPVAGSKWTAKMLFNGSYNMLNAAKWGAANSQPYVGGVGSNFVYFLVPELTLGTFGTADENNGLLFTDEDGVNVQPASVYYKPLGATVPQSLTDGTLITPVNVSYDGKTYKAYETPDAGWLIIPRSYYDSDICAHIAWEDRYDKYVSLDEPETNPEAVVGVLVLEGLLALVHADKYLRGINGDVCDKVVFGDTSATAYRMVDELRVDTNAWTNSATGESDSQGNTLYRHSATVSGIKNGGAACVEGEDGGIPLTVNGTTVSYIDTNATAPASVVFYEVTATSTTKAYTDSIFNGSNINTETGILPINDCSIEAQVAMVGTANITVKYAKNIIDQVAINAATDVPKLQEQVEEHEERITKLEDTAVRTGSYDASVAVGLADNFKGDTVVEAEFYKRKTGDTQSVGSGIAAIKEIRGKSIVWNQLANGKLNVMPATKTYTNGYTTCVLTNGTEEVRMTFGYAQDGFKPGDKILHIAHIPEYHVVNAPYDMLQIITIWNYTKGKSATNSNHVMYRNTDTIAVISTIADTTEATDRCGFYFDLNYSNPFEHTTDDYFIASYNIFNLTKMFGAGNEPATVAEFEKMFPLDYYDYNAGEVIPFAGQNLTTLGKNQYNPATGKANLLGGQTYQLLGTYTGATIDEEAVTLDSNSCFTTTKDCVLEITGGNDTDTFVGLYNGENNTYEPYEKHTLPLDPSQWRDKQGNLVFPYGGMHGVGTAYDYAKVDADGYIRKAVRVLKKIDLGEQTWSLQTDTGAFHCDGSDMSLRLNGTSFLCPLYIGKNKTIANLLDGEGRIILSGHYKRLFLKNSSYTTISDFKAATQGVPLIYELAEPVEVELATPVYAKYLVDKDGTEEITPANGTKPYTTPANLSILYAMDARGEIKNLPKNYLSKESAKNMLNAMVSAGIIASYTMTWDSTNNRYAFVIIAPVEPEENTQS